MSNRRFKKGTFLKYIIMAGNSPKLQSNFLIMKLSSLEYLSSLWS